MSVTWGQLKAMVEAEQKKHGCDDNIQISYLDFPADAENIIVSIDSSGWLGIEAEA